MQVIHLPKHILSCREELEIIIPVSQKWEHKEAKWPGQMHQLDDMAWWLCALQGYPGFDNRPLYPYSRAQVTQCLCFCFSLCSAQ